MPFCVAGRDIADSLDKFSFPTVQLHAPPAPEPIDDELVVLTSGYTGPAAVAVNDGPGSTTTVSDGTPSAVIHVDAHPVPGVSVGCDDAVLPTLEPPVVDAPLIDSVIDSVSTDLDSVVALAPGDQTRRSARIREDALAPVDTSISSDVVSTPAPHDASHTHGQSWTVQSIVGYQPRRERDEYGTPADQFTDHYKVR